jgi:hypothetical protein
MRENPTFSATLLNGERVAPGEREAGNDVLSTIIIGMLSFSRSKEGLLTCTDSKSEQHGPHFIEKPSWLKEFRGKCKGFR